MIFAISIAIANVYHRPEIAAIAISDTLLNKETLPFKGVNFHRQR